jgi:hypothetical protein
VGETPSEGKEKTRERFMMIFDDEDMQLLCSNVSRSQNIKAFRPIHELIVNTWTSEEEKGGRWQAWFPCDILSASPWSSGVHVGLDEVASAP